MNNQDTLYNEVFEAMEALSKLPINEIWEPWCEIANKIIPSNYELKDALDGCDMPILSEYAPGSESLARSIKNRITYLSDRLDIDRCYMLDYKIRYYFGKNLRELDH
jgi:hypothetical protein